MKCSCSIVWHQATRLHMVYMVMTSPRSSVLSECHIVRWHMHKYNSIDIHKQSIVFPVPASTNLTLAEWHYMEIFCTKFQPNQSLNVDVTGRNLFIPICWFLWYSCLLSNFLTMSILNFMKIWQFSDWYKAIVAQMDGCHLHIGCSFFCKEHMKSEQY
jgi:hypothetical protein